MAYIKYKEVTKYFNFSKSISKDSLPKYVNDYVFQDERILCSYKTSRDHGIFTDKKIVLFDNYSLFDIKKHIYTIPYKSISTISIIFLKTRAEISLFLDSGYPLRLKFIDLKSIDKLRLRILYSCISCIINNQKVSETDIKKLIDDNLEIKK